jgi:hypothetical protein
MTYKHALLAGAAALSLIAGGGLDAQAADAPGKGVTIYMQMGGNPGDGATLARQTGAAAAATALGVDKLNAQFSAWAPEKMIAQFKEALAARPSCIVIMGHPGSDAFAPQSPLPLASSGQPTSTPSSSESSASSPTEAPEGIAALAEAPSGTDAPVKAATAAPSAAAEAPSIDLTPMKKRVFVESSGLV